jgi:hypothetical protein
MHARTPITTSLLTATLLLTGCGGGHAKSSGRPTTSAAITATPAAKATSTYLGPKVKPSTKWVPKLRALSDGNGVSDCQTSGSPACLRAMTAAITTYTGILKDITAAGAGTEYKKTVADINQYVRAADAYQAAGCANDPNADIEGSPCYGDALKVATGPSILQFVLPTDELGVGVS